MPRTRLEKLWLGGAVVVALLIAVIGYFFLISPQRAKTSAVQAQVAGAQLQGSTLQTRIVSLTEQQKKLATFRSALVKAQAALPTLDDLSANPALLKSLQNIAQETGTSVTSLTIGNPTAVAAAAPSTTPTASASPSASSSGAATTSAASLYSVALTTVVHGSTASLKAFLTDLQTHQPRAVLITAVTITGATGNATSEAMNLTMTAFVRPSASAAVTSSTPSGTASTP